MTVYFRDPKDPDDIDDFTLDWANRLASGETIATFAAAVVAGTVTVSATSTSGATTIARITGGAAGETATVRYRIVTSAARQFDETATILVQTQ